MSTATKLSFTQEIVATAAGNSFRPPRAEKIARKTLVNVAKFVVVVVAAVETSGWLSVALWVILALAAMPYVAIGIAGQAMRERQARIDALPEPFRTILQDRSRLYGPAA